MSLVAVGFLLGRQNRGAPSEQFRLGPSPVTIATPIPLVGQAEQSLVARVDALQGRVGSLQQQTLSRLSSEVSPKIAPQPTTGYNAQSQNSESAADVEARRVYSSNPGRLQTTRSDSSTLIE